MGNLMRCKISLFIVFLFLLSSCNTKEEKISVFKQGILAAKKNNENQNWIESFNEFRTALYLNDKIKLKSYFKFPVLDENNEIWYLIEDEHQLTFVKGQIKPLTETDFNSYYFKIFDQYFINSILKIKTKELFDKGKYETIILKDERISYNISATYDKELKQLILNFYTEEKFEIDNTGEYEKTELSKIYYFDILPNNKIRFKKVRLAG
jgi:hypothetical protein